MSPDQLPQKIEALLFALGKPLSYAELSKMLGASKDEIKEAVLRMHGGERGIAVVDDGSMVELRVSSEVSALVDSARKEEYSRDIGRAGLEVLAILLYRGPSTRAQIDFVRGVNSTQSLRTLSIRGLIRRIPNPKDERSYLYEPTTDLLSELGAESTAALPDFDSVREKLAALESTYRNAQEKKEEPSEES